jgi:CRP/FNR family transcriptional regulator, cyclic AMP receptor protein
MTITADNLRDVPLLAGLSERERKKLAGNLHERTFAAGHTIAEEGRMGVGFFMILEGTATVSIRGEERATLGPGSIFGELALIDRVSDRRATVVAATELRCACMTAWEFRPFVLEHPEVGWHLLETLAERVRLAEERAAPDAAVS